MSTQPAPASPVPLCVGDTIGSFRLARPLSRGAFGQVWIGENVLALDHCAVKVVPADANGTVELEGVRNYRKLTAPGLIPISELTPVPGRGCYYYTMPLADDASGVAPFPSVEQYDAMTLTRYLKIHCPLPIDKVLAVLLNLLPALHALHERGFLHRDVKPDNVVRVGGTWRWCDVGLIVRGDKSLGRAGTPWYVPPDMVRNDRKADLYALGRTVYELATDHGRGGFGDFMAGALDVPGTDGRCGGLGRVIRTACEPAPQKRYQTAAAMYRDVEALVRRTPITIILAEDFDAFDGARRDELLACLRANGFSVSACAPAIERGSVRVTVELTPDEAHRLEVLARAGRFGTFAIAGVEWLVAAPGPRFRFRLAPPEGAPGGAFEEFERCVLPSCQAEAARAGAGFRVEPERVEVPLALGGRVRTGALEFAVERDGGLGDLCRGLWIGIRALLARRAEPFELEIRIGTGAARLGSEGLRALGRQPGGEAEALERLIESAVGALRRSS